MESANSSIRIRSGTEMVSWASRVLLLTVLYVIAGRLSLEFSYYHDRLTLVAWAPTGFSLAGLILFGRQLWPGVFLGSLLVNLALPLTWPATVGIAVGSTIEVLVGATLLIRVAGFRPTLERVQDGLAFILFGVVGCTAIGAAIGTASVILAGDTEPSRFWPVWLIWWLGGMGGVIIVAPSLFMLLQGTPTWRALARNLESWVLLALVIVTSSGAFFGPDLGLTGFVASLAPFPVLVWAGTRLGPRGAMTASSIIMLTSATATGMGTGPFVNGTMTEAMFLLWSHSLMIGLTAFTLAAVIKQRDAADRRYRSEEEEHAAVEKQKLLLLERERLTREVDDGLGGRLVSVLSMVERGQAAPGEVAEAIRRAIDDLRIVIDSLDPETTDLSTSLGKLRARLDPLLRRNGIDLEWRVDEFSVLDQIPPESSLHVLRIIQEAVTNTLRHSHGGKVELRISGSEDEPRNLHVSIRDDGCGIQMSRAAGGRGIKSMQSRAKGLGATLRIEGSDSGTQIDLTIPIVADA